jgi:D-alanine-D-alanine ligase
MRPTRVLVLYNEPVLPDTHPDAESEHEILYTVEAVARTLLQAGYEVCRLGASHDPAVLVNGLRSLRPEVVFNLFEGTGDHADNEAYVAGVLEWLGLPFTGSPFQTLCLARHKHLTKHLFQGAGLPTPSFFVVDDVPVPECALEWPVIVKPATQDASVGLDQGSVVTDQARLTERVASLLRAYGPPVLVEQFISGREFTVALTDTASGLQALPVSEILFVEKGPGYWPIVTYDAKWKPGTRDYDATPPRYPADVTPKLGERLSALAMQAFRLLGCRDYARVDFRVRPSGKPYLLEVNPNPDFSPTAGFAGALTAGGLSHAQFTLDLVCTALARGQKPASPPVTRRTEPRVRAMQPTDRERIKRIGEGCGAFPPEELAALLDRSEHALGEASGNGYHFLVVEQEDLAVGFACYGRAPRTRGTYTIYGLAVMSAWRGQGLGARLLEAVESQVRAVGGEVILTEASSHPRQTQARHFFLRHGFRLVGDVPAFFGEGESRLTYAKYLK